MNISEIEFETIQSGWKMKEALLTRKIVELESCITKQQGQIMQKSLQLSILDQQIQGLKDAIKIHETNK